jgi:hypothetical protein
MEHSFLFIVSSSINHFNGDELSRNTTHERFLQTLETIQSIRDKVENSKICLFELSQTPIKKEYREEISDKVDLFLEYHNQEDIKTLYENFTNNPGMFKYGKSLFELRGLYLTLNIIGINNLFEDTTRVFKITGRYTLNDSFNIEEYKTKFLTNKYVIKHYNFKDDEPDNNVHYHVYQNKGSVVTALWSFDCSLFNEVIQNVNDSFQYLQKMLLYTNGNDIEHALYKYLDKNKLINCNTLGVSVRKGMDIDDYDE